MTEKLYRWLPIVFGCHCRRDRSFSWNGKQFPLCARCTGELAGIVLACVIGWWYLPASLSSMAMLLPMIADGMVQQLTRYESTNLRRLITGMLFGFGLTALFAHSTMYMLEFGYQLGQNWAG